MAGAVLLGYGINRWLPEIGAGAVLYPARRLTVVATPHGCQDVSLPGADVTLAGWRCPPLGARRATLVYLHGVADNRASGTGIIQRFVSRGFEVVAYDSRAHGESTGHACTYGYFEKEDLRRVLDAIGPAPVVLIGTSLGAAVAIQEAAGDPRVRVIVAAEVFADLLSVVSERAPVFFTESSIARALAVAERRANFDVRAVSPLRAAAQITVPTLLIHGEADVDTSPSHSRRVLAALRGSKRLILVPGAGHNHALSGRAVWEEIEQWVDDALLARVRVHAKSSGLVPGAGIEPARPFRGPGF